MLNGLKLGAELMEATAPGAQPANHLSEAVAYAPIANQPHHFAILVALGATEAVSKVGPGEVPVAYGFLEAGFGMRSTFDMFAGEQTVSAKVVPAWFTKRRDELPEEVLHLECCGARLSRCYRRPSGIRDPLADLVGVLEKPLTHHQRLHAPEVAELSVLKLVLSLELGPVEECTLEPGTSKVAVLKHCVGEIRTPEGKGREISDLEPHG
jgi:hypothetical protein